MKMKLIICALLSFLTTANSFSQTLVAQAKPMGAENWGYIDPGGNFILQPTYEKCFAFSAEGWAPIYDTKAKEFYFINLKGEKMKTEVMGFRLQSILGFGTKVFEDGMIPVEINKKWGFLNSEGKLAVPAKYDKVEEFSGGFAVGETGGKFVILTKAGQEIPVSGKVLSVNHFSEGLAPFQAPDKTFGFIDTKGNTAIPAKFHSVGYFVDGLAWAKTSDKKVGFINKQGEWTIRAQFDAAKEFGPGSGLARVKSGEKWAFVSKSGEILNLTDAESFGNFSEGLCDGKKGEKVGFFDTKGNWVIPPQFLAVRDFKNGYAAAKEGEKWGFIDKKGNWVVKPIFDSAKDFEAVK